MCMLYLEDITTGRTRTELKQDAKQILKANYWPAVWISIVLLIATASSTAAGGSSQTGNEYGYGHQSEFLSDYGWLFVVLAIAVVVIVAVFILLPLEFGSRSTGSQNDFSQSAKCFLERV